MKAESIIRNTLISIGLFSVWQSTFMVHIFMLSLSLRGRYNFSNMARYGMYSETTYRTHFRKKFDFLDFNIHLINSSCPSPKIVVFDPSFIRKSGTATIGVGKYWSGCASKASYGLEIGSFASVELSHKTSMHLIATQTIPDKDEDLMTWYINLFKSHASNLKKISSILAVDAYFSKKNYVDAVVEQDMVVVSRLRYDARMRYLYQGPKTGKKGRPKTFDGKVITIDLDLNKVTRIETDNEDEDVYEGIVYADAMKRKVRAVFVHRRDDCSKRCVKIYFSTDLNMSGIEVLKIYRSRFQIEFLFRDAKQHTGLEQAQCRSKEKLDFHFNLSLSAVSIAKAEQIAMKKGDKPFSMSDVKAFYSNQLLLNRFIKMFNVEANTKENKRKIDELNSIGRIAA